MKTVGIMIKPASGLCNMHCDYCFYQDEIRHRGGTVYEMMTLETLRNVIRRTLLQAEESYSLAFQGGEPTLRGLDFYREAVKLVNRYNRNAVPVSYALQTNGMLLDEEWAAFLSEHKFLVGLSVDGTAEIHNRYRHAGNKDAFAAVIRSAALLDQYHVDYNILTVVHREVAERIGEIYRDYRTRGWNYLQFITCLDPLGEEPGTRPYSLTPERYGRFLCDLFDLWYEDAVKKNAPYIRQFDNYLTILAGYPPEACEHGGICGLQNVVEADGSIYPCDFYVLNEYCLGNLNHDRLPEAYKRRDEIGFRERSVIHPEECQNCPWHFICRNGCYRTRTGGTDSCSGKTYYCSAYRQFFEHSLDKMKSLLS